MARSGQRLAMIGALLTGLAVAAVVAIGSPAGATAPTATTPAKAAPAKAAPANAAPANAAPANAAPAQAAKAAPAAFGTATPVPATAAAAPGAPEPPAAFGSAAAVPPTEMPPAGPVVVTPVVKILPLGDSITWGSGSSTASGYRAELWRRLVEGAGYGIDFVGSLSGGALPDPENEGHPGWTIKTIAEHVDGWVAQYRPDVILLHIGTNDVRSAAGAVGAPERLSALIDQIRSAAPATTLYVAQIVPSTDAAIDARIVAYNAAMPGIVAAKASPNVRLIDLYTPLTRGADMLDTLHPNDAGYVKMAAGWEAALPQTLPMPGGISGRGKCVHAQATGNASGVHIWSCNGAAQQRWTRSGETLRAVGKCMDVDGGRTANGTRVILWPCHGGRNQIWLLRADGSIFNPKSGRCLTIPDGDTTDGNRLAIWDCNRSLNQQWHAV